MVVVRHLLWSIPAVQRNGGVHLGQYACFLHGHIYLYSIMQLNQLIQPFDMMKDGFGLCIISELLIFCCLFFYN